LKDRIVANVVAEIDVTGVDFKQAGGANLLLKL